MYKAIPEVFFAVAAKNPKRTALAYKKEGVYFPISFKELAGKIETFAVVLQSLGISKGDRVGILSENRPEWAISDLAIMAAGGISVPLHTTLNPKAICNVLNHCKAKILIVSNNDLLNKLLVGQKYLKYLEKIIFLESITAGQKEFFSSKILSWKAVFSLNQEKKYENIFLDPDDPCSIIYTSGTTGKPKGVVLTHRNLLSNFEAVVETIPVKESDVFLSFLPLSHVLERMGGFYVPLLSGASIFYSEGIGKLAVNLKEVKPTILISVPRVFEKLNDAVWDKVNSSNAIQQNIFRWALKQKKGTLKYRIADFLVFRKIRRKLGGKLRLTISGGASLNERIAKFFSKLGVVVLEGYGLTETSPIISVNREADFRFGTAGKILPGVKVKIAENKEILVKGPNVFCGYFNNKKEGKACFTRDGWFCTGDMGFLDNQGFLTIIGRQKEMIVTSGGKNVWPEKIENTLNADRFIAQSMVIGNNRKFISALVVPDWQELEIFLKEKNIPLQEHEKVAKDPRILSLFRERFDTKINPLLSDYEKVIKFEILPQELSQKNDELTPTLKLRRHIVEKHYDKNIELMYQ